MIKCENGIVIIKGNPAVIAAEFGSIARRLWELAVERDDKAMMDTLEKMPVTMKMSGDELSERAMKTIDELEIPDIFKDLLREKLKSIENGEYEDDYEDFLSRNSDITS